MKSYNAVTVLMSLYTICLSTPLPLPLPLSTLTLAFIGKPSWTNTRLPRQERKTNSSMNSNAQFKPLSQPNLNRGEKYNHKNSSLPSPAIVAQRLGVKPTKEASSKTWQRAWKTHKRLIPLLHSTDSCKPPDSSLNLACMWWKSLSGNDKSSPVYDNGLAYDLLPSGWRKIVNVRLRKLYPRLHHGNVELRTAYLDSQINEIVQKVRSRDGNENGNGNGNGNGSDKTLIRLICMGAGYDTRGVKMLERNTVDQVVELDLPEVVNAKERLFERLLKRRPWLRELTMPTLVPSDFNNVPDVRQKLDAVLRDRAQDHERQRQRHDDDADEEEEEEQQMITKCHTIFVFEGVMIYLNDGVPSSLLNITSSVLSETNLEGSLCFADRLENVPGGDFDLGVKELENNGWQMKDWCPKPGLARHMGSAKLL